MLWLLFAFSGPVFWAVSTHIDKYLVEKYFKQSNVTVLMVFTGIIGLFLLPFIWWFRPEVLMLPLASIIVMIFSGLLYMAAILLYLYALQTEEVSVVAPLFQAAPLFGFALAYIFLGEMLSHMQMLGGLIIVGGAVLLSLDPRSHNIKFRTRPVLFMLSATFLVALSSVIFKFFAVADTYWATTFWTYAGEAIFGFIILLIPTYFRQFTGMFKKHPGAVLGVNAANELINLGGGLGVRYALLLAPLALVQAISGTTVLFIFLFGIVLSVFLPKFGREDLSPRNLIQKGISTVLIAAGIILINLR